MKILITGSSGYIGSSCYEYLKSKFKVFGLDKNKPKLKKQNNFFLCNLNNISKLDKIFKKVKPDLIIHLAGESTVDNIKKAKKYKVNNVLATDCLLKIINKNKIKFLIFASTAAVYQNQNKNLNENSKIKPNNVYGLTKLQCENNIKKTLQNSITKFIIFRFFNVCSSFFDKKIGEYHKPETHFIPIITQKFYEKKKIIIYGKNYRTPDGTCVRDYIHIKDLMKAIFKGIFFLNNNSKNVTINLGTNHGYSVLEILKIASKIFKENNPANIFLKKRRKGDVSSLVCSNKKASKLLKWVPVNSKISKIIYDELEWIKYLKRKNFYRKTIY